MFFIHEEMEDRHPQYLLLETFWDNKHQAQAIAEERRVSIIIWFLFSISVILVSIFIFFFYMQVLQQLRLCMHNPLLWDDRYILFIRHVDFLLLVRLVTGGLPIMDTTALFTLVDRWAQRPITSPTMRRGHCDTSRCRHAARATNQRPPCVWTSGSHWLEGQGQ
jgi:hypothetical protein